LLGLERKKEVAMALKKDKKTTSGNRKRRILDLNLGTQGEVKRDWGSLLQISPTGNEGDWGGKEKRKQKLKMIKEIEPNHPRKRKNQEQLALTKKQTPVANRNNQKGKTVMHKSH